jgi:hypothetical protein
MKRNYAKFTPMDVLLVEDSPGDVRLTQEIVDGYNFHAVVFNEPNSLSPIAKQRIVEGTSNPISQRHTSSIDKIVLRSLVISLYTSSDDY